MIDNEYKYKRHCSEKGGAFFDLNG